MLEVDEDSRLGLEILGQGSRYGASHVPSDDLTADLYELAVDELTHRRYEISNFARPGWESRHNLKYWRLEPYAGFGADAHGFDGSLRAQNVETAQEYVKRWKCGEPVRISETPSSPGEEKFFVGLRLLEGVSPTGQEWIRLGEPIGRMLGEGLLERDGGVLRLTRRGVLLSNEVFQEFLTA
jgi:oxygen-independent coproporphyrinogen-3 oxidase